MDWMRETYLLAVARALIMVNLAYDKVVHRMVRRHPMGWNV